MVSKFRGIQAKGLVLLKFENLVEDAIGDFEFGKFWQRNLTAIV